ncbi:E3 ubiquitin-protein ligase SIAH1B-like [Dermacentor andersoni]|uniref:E3 ubiquitin-protein ligase SIAH1B-like n=1 Tax=Dermacentor andersoni TaxID=34620 RepID=UPI002416DBC9|nr:E3 ubiquitin-protein ligase SIAH1B-like [Dermacentor andersoni]
MASVTSVCRPSRAQTSSSITQMASLLECPVCKEYALPPIMQCENGHHLCATCRKKVAKCPVCRAPKGKNRNLALEKLAETAMFPCKYNPKGCAAVLLIGAKKKHEDSCEHGPCPCVLGLKPCKWRGPLREVVDHILRTHEFVPRLQGENVVLTATRFNRTGAFCWVALQSCLGRDFAVMLKKRNNFRDRFFGVVLLVGSSEDARGFVYRLQLCGAEHRLTWEAKPRSLHTRNETIRSGDGLTFDMSTAERLSNGADLNVNVFIRLASSSGDIAL